MSTQIGGILAFYISAHKTGEVMEPQKFVGLKGCTDSSEHNILRLGLMMLPLFAHSSYANSELLQEFCFRHNARFEWMADD